MSLVDGETGELLASLTPEKARKLTDQIASTYTYGSGLVHEAYQKRAWSALGYESWEAYCSAEFGTIQLPAEERESTLRYLRDAGLSLRGIAAATGLSKSTDAAS